MANFFILKNSDSSVEKKFRVIFSGYNRILEKNQSINTTIDGELDVSVGSVKERFIFVVRVRHEEPVSGYGTMADLEYFYRLNNPNGTPSNVITFTNHYGVSFNVIMNGELSQQAQGIQIIGDTAWFLFNSSFMKL